ncbi:nif-specific transcriptional activator NifA [Derxia lacustris]|uniref:nif-specific transcriptional activator NifA n=1 Tax=Derxia lacustris TaxID=764842 RepID=UPI000A16F84B|nr:nif-specific transcriptional activator NifA [Derxia lacustris]
MQEESKSTSRARVELVTIYAISRILSSSLDLSRTFREALNVLTTHMDFRRGMVVLEDPDGGLMLTSSVGMSLEERELGHYQAGEGVIGRVYSNGVPVVVPDITEEPEFAKGTQPPEPGQRIGFAAVPIKSSRGVLGVLAIDRVTTGVGGFRDDLPLLTMVATLMSQTIVLNRNVTAERDQWMSETRRLKRELKGRFNIDNAIGHSKRMQEVFAEVHQVGPSRSTVLLRGESGTGKEVIARAVHELSPRAGAAFVKVNCAALTESLLESELFGHEKGAFTGAVGDRKGRFELANGGTLFLDEIGDISPAFQAKLLRVLQEREFERVGGIKAIKVDVRLICATNRNLEKMVAAGTFRADLYYRINVVSIFLPPLRERREDIPPLVTHILERYNKDNKRELRVSPDAMRVLYNCYWPGNVRELENCVERTATMTQGKVIEAMNFPCCSDRCLTQMLHNVDKDDAVAAARLPAEAVIAPPVSRHAQPPADIGHAGGGGYSGSYSGGGAPMPAFPPMPREPVTEGGMPEFDGRAFSSRPAPSRAEPQDEKPQGERERLIWAMERSGWVQAKAARLLNITPRQMGYALQKYQIEVRKF